MSKDNETGVSKQVAGSLKEAIGKITGDTKTEVDGTAEKNAGEAERNEFVQTNKSKS